MINSIHSMDKHIDILARTIYGEARGEYKRLNGGLPSLIAVANVIMNRLNSKNDYGQSIAVVCLKAWQFSCWNHSDPNRVLLHQENLENEPIFQLCQNVAQHVVLGDWPDVTKGSDHYHTTAVKPTWSLGKKPMIQIGNHLFFRLGERKGERKGEGRGEKK